MKHRVLSFPKIIKFNNVMCLNLIVELDVLCLALCASLVKTTIIYSTLLYFKFFFLIYFKNYKKWVYGINSKEHPSNMKFNIRVKAYAVLVLACECIPLSHPISPIYVCVCVSQKKKKKKTYVLKTLKTCNLTMRFWIY